MRQDERRQDKTRQDKTRPLPSPSAFPPTPVKVSVYLSCCPCFLAVNLSCRLVSSCTPPPRNVLYISPVVFISFLSLPPVALLFAADLPCNLLCISLVVIVYPLSISPVAFFLSHGTPLWICLAAFVLSLSISETIERQRRNAKNAFHEFPICLVSAP